MKISDLSQIQPISGVNLEQLQAELSKPCVPVCLKVEADLANNPLTLSSLKQYCLGCFDYFYPQDMYPILFKHIVKTFDKGYEEPGWTKENL